jgi:hypothetical protein
MLQEEHQSKAAEQHVLTPRVTDLNWLLAGTFTAAYAHPEENTVHTIAQWAVVAKSSFK